MPLLRRPATLGHPLSRDRSSIGTPAMAGGVSGCCRRIPLRRCALGFFRGYRAFSMPRRKNRTALAHIGGGRRPQSEWRFASDRRVQGESCLVTGPSASEGSGGGANALAIGIRWCGVGDRRLRRRRGPRHAVDRLQRASDEGCRRRLVASIGSASTGVPADLPSRLYLAAYALFTLGSGGFRRRPPAAETPA